ncbi:1-acyl-sn-glycerol-3-phosphate acyltransferase [bacterium SCSIO 12643]|nr:1-acyl-sn-glycerol-3-phosphate acyltransferase [bacterium SCSIO 12643]
MRLTLKSYFKVLKVTGKENIPNDGPIIFVANHPSTLMDPVVIGAIVRPQLYFLAAAEFMGKGIVTWLMQKLFNMIPIYRPNTLPDKSAKNGDVFEKCFTHLSNNGSILIFPEGSSITEKKLRPLKTGVARIAFGAEKRHDVQVQIIPIGLNYSDPHSFQSELYVRIGKPILTLDIDSLQLEDEFEKAKALTQIIEDRLKENLIHLEDEKLEALFEKVRRVSAHELRVSNDQKLGLEDKFKLDQEIQDGMAYYANKHPEVLEIITRNLDNYIRRSDFYGVSDSTISRGVGQISWYDYMRIILGIPVFVFGFLANSLPYYATIWIFRRFKIDPSFHGSIGMSIGMVLYLIWYIGWGVYASSFIGYWWFGFLLISVVYLAGRFTLKYLSLIFQMRQQGKLNRLLRKDRNVLKALFEERNEIIREIVMYSEKYKSELEQMNAV